MKDIRWQQRFENFARAFLFLKKATTLEHYDELQSAGVVQAFEFAFELAWKTLKDYLEQMGDTSSFPREVIKKSFAGSLIKDGSLWIEMLDNRNMLSHTYNQAQSSMVLDLICKKYVFAIEQVYCTLKEKI